MFMSVSYTRLRRSLCSLIVPGIAKPPPSLMTAPLGAARINLAQRRRELERAQAALLVKLALESGDEVELRAGRQRSRLGDPIVARGVPCIGRGIQGAIHGTRPGDGLFR
jgi:hypothetical protein